MKRLYRFLSALLAVSLLTVTGVFAIETNATDFSLTASVSHSEGCTVIDVILNEPDERVPVAMSVTAPDGSVDYMSQGYTDEDGAIRFRYIQKGESGDYTVTANAVSVQKSVKLSYLAQSGLSQIVDVFLKELHSSSPSWETVKEAMLANREALFLDMTVYDKLKNSDNVYKLMLSDTADNANVKSVSDLVNLFHIAVMLTALDESGDSAMMEKFLTEEPYRSSIEFDIIMLKPESDVYALLSDKAKEELMSSVPKAKKYTSLSMLQESVQTNALCKGLQYAQSWKHIEPLLKVYQKAELLNISFTDYNSLKNTSAVMENMIGQSYSGYRDVETKFAQYVNHQKENEDKKTSGGNGGGGGGGGGGSSSTKNPVLVTPDKTQTAPVEPTPAQPPADTSINFVDIDEAKWATRPITKLAEAGIISGTGDGRFQPNRAVTRAEFVKMLIGLLDDETEQNPAQSFGDVSESDWAFPYVNKASRVGLVVGSADGLFHPNDLVTREEMAVMTVRLLQRLELLGDESGSASAFADAETVSEWAADSVTALKNAGIVNGDLGNKFNPQNSLTRAEAAQIIYNVLSSAEEV